MIDFENVALLSAADVAQLPAACHITIFYSSAQKIFVRTAAALHRLDGQVDYMELDGSGENALDFYIACYLGQWFCESPQTRFVIVSNDKGFDPLMRHMQARGCDCRRVGHAAAAPKSAPPKPEPVSQSSMPQPSNSTPSVSDEHYLCIIANLSTMKHRPKSRKTLTNHCRCTSMKECSAEKIEILIDRLFSEGKLTKNGEKLCYHL